jgi:hypothetical protein
MKMRGPKKNTEQIKALQDSLGQEGVTRVKNLIGTHSVSEITLAYKLTRKATSRQLPKTVDKLIAKLDPKIADEVRNRLMEANK